MELFVGSGEQDTDSVYEVILLWWGYRFWFMLIFCIVYVPDLGIFIPSSSVFIELMLHAIYGQLYKHVMFVSEFYLISNFRANSKK